MEWYGRIWYMYLDEDGARGAGTVITGHEYNNNPDKFHYIYRVFMLVDHDRQKTVVVPSGLFTLPNKVLELKL